MASNNIINKTIDTQTGADDQTDADDQTGADDQDTMHFIENNVFRRFSTFANKNINLASIRNNKYYMDIHNIFIFFICFIALFNNSVLCLSALLLIVSLDAFSIVILHECPLTLLEKKYINTTSCEIRTNYLKKMGILHNRCDNNYENQIELLINAWMMIAGKCLCILFLNTVNVKLFNYNNIYVN